MTRVPTSQLVGAERGDGTVELGQSVKDVRDHHCYDIGDCFRRFGRQLLSTLCVFLAVSMILTNTRWMGPGRENSGGEDIGREYIGLEDSGGEEDIVREDRLRIALCFFGLTRRLRWTFPSIKSRVFDVLQKKGMDYNVFVHTYSLKEINNERAKEFHVAYSAFTEDYLVLQPTRSLVTNQDDLDLAFPNPLELTKYSWKYIREGTAEGVVRNVFRAYWSMMLAWGLMAEYAHEHDVQYDAVVLLRADTWYHMKIDIGRRTFPLPEDVVFMPTFDTDPAPRGRKNDRFSYGSVTAMRVMVHRMDTLLEHDVEHFDNSDLDTEWVLGRHLWRHNIAVATMPFAITRVRMDGSIPFFDHERVRVMCTTGLDPMACVMVNLGFSFPVKATQEELFNLSK